MRVWVDIHDASGTKLGDGPIINVLRARVRDRLSRVGDFELEVPATAPGADLIQERREAAIWGLVNGVVTYLGGGPIDEIRTRIREDDTATLVLKGGDLLRELTRRTTGDLLLTGSGNANEVTLLNRMIFQNWTYTRLGPGDTPPFKARFVHEPLLGAILAMCEKTGSFFRRVTHSSGDPRHLEILRAPDDSGVFATMHGDANAIAANPDACIITDIEIVAESYDLKSRAYAWGVGEGDDRLTLASAETWPDGGLVSGGYTLDGHTYRLNKAGNYVYNDTLEQTGEQDEIALTFKDIGPLTNSDADLAAAGNYLLLASVQYLHPRRQPYRSYRLRVTSLQKALKPGQKIRVQARKYADGEKPIDIDQTLYVLEVERTVDQFGIGTASLVVANALRWPEAGEFVARQLRSSDVMQAHPQMGPVLDTVAGEGMVDDTYNATFFHWLKNAVTTVGAVYFRFTALPIRAPVKEIVGSAGLELNISGTVDTPDHQHYITIIGNGAGPLAYQVGYGAGGTAGGLRHNINSTDHVFPTDAGSGGVSNVELDIDGEVDLSGAISLQYGIYNAPDQYQGDEMEISVNGDGYTAITSGHAVSGAPGWYEVDITSRLVKDNKRPQQEVNWVTIRIRGDEKDGRTGARIVAQIERRLTIQSVALT